MIGWSLSCHDVYEIYVLIINWTLDSIFYVHLMEFVIRILEHIMAFVMFLMLWP